MIRVFWWLMANIDEILHRLWAEEPEKETKIDEYLCNFCRWSWSGYFRSRGKSMPRGWIDDDPYDYI